MRESDTAAQYEELVRQLHEPWSRRAARQKLVAARADVIEKALTKEDRR